MWPSGVQMCPTTVISRTHNNDFLLENIPPQYFIHWTMQFRFCKVLPDEAADPAVPWDCLEGAVGGLVSRGRTLDGDIVNVGDRVLGNLRLRDVHHIVVEDGDSVSPTHREFGETEGAIQGLESGVVAGRFGKHAFIVSDIQVEHPSAGTTCELLGDLFSEGSDAGVLDCDGVERFETVDGTNGVGFFLCYAEPARVV